MSATDATPAVGFKLEEFRIRLHFRSYILEIQNQRFTDMIFQLRIFSGHSSVRKGLNWKNWSPSEDSVILSISIYV